MGIGGQRYDKCRPLPFLARNRNIPPVIADNPVDEGEPQPRAGFLSSVERNEYPRYLVLGDPASIIGDLDVKEPLASVRPGLDHYAAVLPDRLRGVGEDIQECLAAGCNEFQAKPVDFQELFGKIEKCILK